jgi:riboflavin biosynthesis pyrimidine reductase
MKSITRNKTSGTLMLDLQLASLPEIAAHYESEEPSWVRANMIISQDGHFVGAGDSSRDLTGESDLKLLLLLRALSDAVLVGASTARQESYRQPKQRAEYTFLNRPAPRLVIVSASLDFDVTSNLFHGGEHRTLVINAGDNVASEELLDVADVVSVKNDDNFVTSLFATLSELKLSKVTCEGGPTLLSQLLLSRAVDEYDLTLSPITVGGTPQWPEALPLPEVWEEVASASSGEFEFKRLLRRS